MWRGWTLILRGELRDAEASLREALADQRLWGNPRLHYSTAHLIQALVERGNLDEARGLLDVDPAPTAPTWPGHHWRRARVELLLAEGKYEEALAAAQEAARLIPWIEHPVAPFLSLQAQALDALERTDEALPLAERELELARRWGAPGTVGRTLRVLGTLRRKEGLPQLEEAVAVLEDSTARLELAKALAALGSTRRRDRKPTEAREPLRRALELADVCGADGLVQHIRSELYAAGSRPRREALRGVESLTPSERRVADLAAAGRTNRDIAQELYVTPKTVEVHLSNAYRKLDIGSRRELAGALAGA
jgi:DNA-binding NarL/FixJ family response regulator